MISVQSVPDLPVLRSVSEDFEAGDPVREACVNIVIFIAANAEKNLNYLTFGMLLNAAKLNQNQGETLHRAIAYLTGARAQVLDIGYEFILDDFEYELESDEVEMFLSTDTFYDPRTGQAVVECAHHIYVFFRPNWSRLH
jgi:hypothetical protein